MEMKERHRRGSVSGGGGAGGAGFLEGEEAPLLPGGLRNRRRRDSQPRYEPTDWDDSLPYGGKVYLARRKLPDSRLCVALQVAVVAASLGTLYYAWFHSDHMHFHLVKAYAHLGHREAQATAAEQGHPQASYNLAVGHLQGHTTQLKPGEAHKLIRHAASHGVPEAEEVMKRVCSKGHCDE
ncbi:hypothetical protein O3P69_005302 [Scylla paramamosain]|uniref:Uncharacterized protein n=1 Tax=Scylla paramamosain TaxID=85552 RepID=A0AAW0U9Q5_SCYPA